MEEIGRGLWEMERVPELIPQYMWNAVYLNTGTDHFEEAAHLTGMDATGWTFGPSRLADLDNDGRDDVFFTCGHDPQFRRPRPRRQTERRALAGRARPGLEERPAAPRDDRSPTATSAT